MANKILNDPIYGLIDIPSGIVADLIEHPYFQRLRRVNQLGLTHYVYPAATHTRFSHCIGAMHLTCEAVKVLKAKGIDITDDEAEGVIIAILLHDLGHGPFSHSLEHHLLSVHHEELSLALMKDLNEAFDGQLTLAIKIFKNEYHKKFLHQLVSGQLDMDRLDYLSRDSFFTGVIDGKVSHDRILKTLDVFDDGLVIEFKGIYSIENFLNARRLMYWQVYLHKNVICASEMMIQAIQRARQLVQQGVILDIPTSLLFFLRQNITKKELQTNSKEILYHFQNLDDADIIYTFKKLSTHSDFILSYLCKNLIERRLFKIEMKNHPLDSKFINNLRKDIRKRFTSLSEKDIDYLILQGREANRAYKKGKTAICIKLKDNTVHPISKWKEHNIQEKEVIKYFICYPK